MNSKETILEILQQAFTDAGFSLDQEIHIEHPQDMSHGDWACTNALGYAKKNGLNPREVSEKVVGNVSGEYIEKVEVAGPGFINITLSNEYWKNQLEKTGSESWGTVDMHSGEKWLIEHTQPNLFKPFHIGHLVNNAFGNSFVQIAKAGGVDVVELSFPSDIGPGIAKAVWALIEKGWDKDFDIEQIGQAYAYGSGEYKENPEAKDRIDEINRIIYDQVESREYEVYKAGTTFCLEYLKRMVATIGTTFDDIIYETESEIKGKELVKKHTGSIFEESEGAIIFRGSEHGLFDNVFINSAGFGTYLTKDIGLMWHKWDRFDPFNKSVYVTDMEQKQHFQLVAKAGGMIEKEWEEKSSFIHHGRLTFAGGKISSRYGNVPLAEDLIAQVEEGVMTKMLDRDIPEEDKLDVAKKVSISALRYSFLKTTAGKNMVFDFEKSLSFEGNSGPYIQYTYVRAQSILSKLDMEVEVTTPTVVPEVARMIERFPEMIEKSLHDFSPHHVAQYVYELAQSFNSFYAETKIADQDNPDFGYNVALTIAVATTLKKGLALLGIDTVEQM